MKLIKLEKTDADRAAPLAAGFRTELSSYRGIVSAPDIDSGREELLEYLEGGWPVFGVEEGGELIGYMVLRVEGPVHWVEQLYVSPEHRRRGAASMLFEKAEQIAGEIGEDTVYNYVHPNNEAVIAFLRSKGYTVLNLIEIRRPYAGEKLTTKIDVGGNSFDY